MPSLPKPVAWVLKALVAAACIYFVIHKVPWQSVGPAIRKCNFAFIALSIFLQYGVALANAMRWKALLRYPGLALHKYLYFVFLGQFANLFLPTYLAGEALKVFAFGRKYGGTQENIGIALLSKSTGMVMQILMGATGLIFYARELGERGLFNRIQPGTFSFILLGITLLGAIGALWWFRNSLKNLTFVRTILEIATDRKLVIQTLFWTMLIQLFAAASSYCLFISLWPDTHFWEVVLYTTIILGVLSLPFGFGGVGIREYLNLLLFTDVGGIPAHITFAVNIVGYIPVLSIALTGGFWMALRRLK